MRFKCMVMRGDYYSIAVKKLCVDGISTAQVSGLYSVADQRNW